MRLALLTILIALPIPAQTIGLVAKPWPATDPKDLLGLRKHLVWELSITCPTGVTSFRRQDVAAALAVSELGYTASIDVLEKAQKLDSRGLGAKAGKILLKAGEAGMGIGGAITGNIPLALSGLALALGEGATDVLESVTPQTLRYVPSLLPDNNVDIACVNGRGGQFLVLTGPVKKPEPIKVAARRVNFGECSEGRPSEAFNGPECWETVQRFQFPPVSDPNDPVAMLGGPTCVEASLGEALSRPECVDALMQHLPGGRHGPPQLPAGLDPKSCITYTTIPATIECAPISQAAPTFGPITITQCWGCEGWVEPEPATCEPHSQRQAESCAEAWTDYRRVAMEADPTPEKYAAYEETLKAERLIREHSAQVGAGN